MLQCDRWVRLERGQVVRVYRSEGSGQRFGAVLCGGELVVDVDYHGREYGQQCDCWRPYVSVRCSRCRHEHEQWDVDDCVDLVQHVLEGR